MILKCFKDLKSILWFTLGSEDKTIFCDTLDFKSRVRFTLGSLKKKEPLLHNTKKFKKGLKIAQVLASLVSEGGMSTFKR